MKKKEYKKKEEKLAKKFQVLQEKVSGRLRSGFARRAREATARELHTLKATAATLGAAPLSQMAARLEAGVKNGAWDDEELPPLLDTLRATCDAMRRETEDGDPPPPAR